MDSLRPYGAIAARELKVGENGATTDAGTLEIEPAYRLAGHVVFADNGRVPEGARVMISRQRARDYQTAIVAADGTFSFTGLPREQYSLATSVRGYRVSPKNASFDVLNRNRLLGVIEGRIDGFRLLLEPSPVRSPTNLRRFTAKLLPEYERRKGRPLEGAPVD
jgi:hypothetical protein